MTHPHKKIVSLSTLWIVLAFLIVITEIRFLAPLYSHQLNPNKIMPAEPGHEFADLKPFLKDVQETGFITDKDMSPERNDGMFLKAQYALAPVVLRLNETDTRFLVLDPHNVLSGMAMINEIGADLVHMNKYNKALAEQK